MGSGGGGGCGEGVVTGGSAGGVVIGMEQSDIAGIGGLGDVAPMTDGGGARVP